MKSVYFLRLLLSFVFIFLFVGAARAVNFTVNNNADTSDVAAGNGICADTSGNCTLRAAIEEANMLAGDDTINFAASLANQTITLTTGVEIPINGLNGTLQINGPGADKLTIDGGAGSNRIFSALNAVVTVTGVKLKGGGSSGGVGPDGGAIFANGGTIVLSAVLVQNNNAQTAGGGIYLSGGANHRILDSTISGNSAFGGGGLYLTNGGTLFVANTTISGNSSTGQAAGVSIGGATATFRNSTITNNTANSAIGGIQVSGASLNLGNTIVAGNSAVGGIPEIGNFSAANTTSTGNNFIGDSAGDSTDTISPITYQASDIRDKNTLLGILQNNGGTTPTHALTAGSLAINAGDNAKAVDPFNNLALAADQRGFTPRTAGGTVDIGAYEFNSAPPTAASVSIGGRVSVSNGRGLARARVFLTNQSGETRTALTDSSGYFRFDDVTAGGTYVLTIVSKRYLFAPQVVSVTEELTELDFTAGR